MARAARGARLFAVVAAITCAIACLVPSAGTAAGTGGLQRFGVRSPYRIAADSVLQYVQSQQLPSGRVRLLFQFTGPVQSRPVSVGATANFVVQFLGAATSPSVPNIIPVNLPPIQTVSVAQQGNTLTVSVAMTSAVQPKVLNAPGNLVVVEVPGTSYTQPAQQNFQQQPAAAAQARSGATQTQLIRLHFADVSEVVGILSGNASVGPGNVFNPQPTNIGTQQGSFGQGNFGQGGFGQAINAGQTLQPFQQFSQYQQAQPSEQQALGQRISDNLAIDRRLNALIITGTPDQIAQAVALINQIDIPVQSVLLDTEVLEVTETGQKSIGLDYDQDTATPISRIFNTQAQVLNNIPSQAVAGALAIQSNIWALVSTGKARVLASPKILTQNGLSASILTGDSLPIRVTTPVGVGGVGAVSSQVEYINVGVNLQILPRVTGNGGVDADIYSQVSSVTGFDSSGDPQISTRQAQTRVNLLEGQTLVIGGLLQQRDIHNLQKVWLLGDIPLLGYLFRFYTETKQNTNLVITVTPHVVPAPGMPPPAGAPPATGAPGGPGSPSQPLQ
jgi:general secretion pathway protein D